MSWKRGRRQEKEKEIKNIFTPLNPMNVGHLTGAENPARPVQFEDHLTGVNPV